MKTVNVRNLFRGGSINIRVPNNIGFRTPVDFFSKRSKNSKSNLIVRALCGVVKYQSVGR